jgi:hypothetical protein
MRLGAAEIELLKAVARNEASLISSHHRVRLELLGLAVDTARGLRLTAAGVDAARNARPTPLEEDPKHLRRLDAIGRKRMFSRAMPA